MVNLHDEMKKALNQTMPIESVFSEREKQQVLNRIQQGDVNRKKKKFIFEKLISGTFASISIVALCTVIGVNTGLIKNPIDSMNAGVLDNQLPSPYSSMDIGTHLNGWSLESKQVLSIDKNTATAVFSGETEITGQLVINDQDLKRNSIIFLPNKESLSQLPINENVVPTIQFNPEDRGIIYGMFGAPTPGTLDNISLSIDGYTVTFKKNEEVPDIVNLKEIFFPEVADLKTYSFPLMWNGDTFLLPENLEAIYSDYKNTLDENLLKGLKPEEVFTLWFYADQIEDYKTQYSLFIDDEEYQKTFESYDEYFEAKQNPEERKLSSLISTENSPSLQVKMGYGENSAFVILSEVQQTHFGLTKSKKGIWKVNWMPIQ